MHLASDYTHPFKSAASRHAWCRVGNGQALPARSLHDGPHPAKTALDSYRNHWHEIGGALAMAVGGTTALASKRMTRPQILCTQGSGERS